MDEGGPVTVVWRVVLGVAGGVLLIIGLALGGLTVWGWSVFGQDGQLRTSAGLVAPVEGTVATLIDVDRFAVAVPYLQGLGRVTLSASPAEVDGPAAELFLGAARTQDVDAYLQGAAYSVALRQSGSWTVTTVPGASVPARPGALDLWLGADVGPRPSIEMPATRPLTVVLMDPSVAPTGPVLLSVDFTIPGFSTWMARLLGAACALVLLGAVLLVLSLRRRRPSGRHRAGAPVPTDSQAGDDVLV